MLIIHSTLLNSAFLCSLYFKRVQPSPVPVTQKGSIPIGQVLIFVSHKAIQWKAFITTVSCIYILLYRIQQWYCHLHFTPHIFPKGSGQIQSQQGQVNDSYTRHEVYNMKDKVNVWQYSHDLHFRHPIEFHSYSFAPCQPWRKDEWLLVKSVTIDCSYPFPFRQTPLNYCVKTQSKNVGTLSSLNSDVLQAHSFLTKGENMFIYIKTISLLI